MILAHWKNLCIDAAVPRVAADFWSAVLDLQVELLPDGDAVLRGQQPGETIWVNQVPEAKTVKNRVHLDLVRPDVRPLLGLGARALQKVEHEGYHWDVLTDPQGNEFCIFDAAQEEPSALVVDAADPAAAARWWAKVFDARLLVAPGGDLRWLGNVAALPYDVIKFVGVADPKIVKNRLHWDVQADDVASLVELGAHVLREPDDEVNWHLLADPEGNEFCASASRS